MLTPLTIHFGQGYFLSLIRPFAISPHPRHLIRAVDRRLNNAIPYDSRRRVLSLTYRPPPPGRLVDPSVCKHRDSARIWSWYLNRLVQRLKRFSWEVIILSYLKGAYAFDYWHALWYFNTYSSLLILIIIFHAKYVGLQSCSHAIKLLWLTTRE